MSTNNQISPMQFCCYLVLPFLNNPKDLDLSYKTDLDFGIVFEGKKTPSYKRRNTVLSKDAYQTKPSDQPRLQVCFENS